MLDSTREIGLDVSADITKYMFMSRDQNARRIQCVRIDSITFQRMEQFKVLGTNYSNKNFLAEEINHRLM